MSRDVPTPLRRLRRALGRATVAGLLAAPAAVTVSGAPAVGAGPSAEGSDLTMVQANLLSPQSHARFLSDAKTVLGLRPDLITYNEVAFRQDHLLAPEGYQLWRSPKDRYTRATPVAWRSDRFVALDQGTRMISDWRGRPPGRSTEIGRRRANWVTLESTEGRVLSLVSVHIAPRSTGMPDLHRRSVQRLCALVEQLASSGPVLVGGDFNVPVGGSRYQHDLYAAAEMQSTYQLLGNKFGTSDHGDGRAAIDYIFIRGTDQLQVDTHFPVELRSDHDAVVAGLSWITDAPSTVTRVLNIVDGTRAERRAVARELVEVIGSASPGERIDLATRGLELGAVVRSLRQAMARGVSVRVTSLSRRLGEREQRLRADMAGSSTSWVRRCQRKCAQDWIDQMGPSMILKSDGDGTPRLRVDVDRWLQEVVVLRPTTATLHTGDEALEEARAGFAQP